MWRYNYAVSPDELYHYGVVGMKWGVKRAIHKIDRNKKLERKALKYDKRSAKFKIKSEKRHAIYDLESGNKKAIKAAKWSKKASRLALKANKQDDEFKREKLERKSEKFKYKSAKATIDGNRISKTTGYGMEAMKYSVKSDKMAKKAANARRKIANNKYYVSKMNRKISTIPVNELREKYSFVNQLLEKI